MAGHGEARRGAARQGAAWQGVTNIKKEGAYVGFMEIAEEAGLT